MRIYFIPFACSLALRIASEEAGIAAEFVRVPKGEVLPDGRQFGELSPLGYVPTIELQDGSMLHEGVATLMWLADLAPPGVLAPVGAASRALLLEWLTFIATELHKGIFHPLMTRDSNEGARSLALSLVPSRFAHLARELDRRLTLLDDFSVADAYLLAVLNWCEHAGVDLSPYPAVDAWRDLTRARPSVARAIAVELPLLQAG